MACQKRCELHRGATPGCLKRFGFNLMILHFGIVYRKSWSVLFRWSISLSFVASQHQNAMTLRQNRGVRKPACKKKQ